MNQRKVAPQSTHTNWLKDKLVAELIIALQLRAAKLIKRANRDFWAISRNASHF
jgi:hypothetical protein